MMRERTTHESNRAARYIRSGTSIPINSKAEVRV
jgi:hypothetical protein